MEEAAAVLQPWPGSGFQVTRFPISIFKKHKDLLTMFLWKECYFCLFYILQPSRRKLYGRKQKEKKKKGWGEGKASQAAANHINLYMLFIISLFNHSFPFFNKVCVSPGPSPCPLSL